MSTDILETRRAKHLKWCKDRALEYLEAGDPAGAFASLSSDLDKDDLTASSLDFLMMVGSPQLASGYLNDPDHMRDFITGFN